MTQASPEPPTTAVSVVAATTTTTPATTMTLTDGGKINGQKEEHQTDHQIITSEPNNIMFAKTHLDKRNGIALVANYETKSNQVPATSFLNSINSSQQQVEPQQQANNINPRHQIMTLNSSTTTTAMANRRNDFDPRNADNNMETNDFTRRAHKNNTRPQHMSAYDGYNVGVNFDSEDDELVSDDDLNNDNNNSQLNDNEDDDYDGRSSQEEEDLLSEAILTVASAEEYAAKITKLQQACLTPLKEDLAEWLNKILKTSNITTENFMDRLDNGVIICRLAKIISQWCAQQLAQEDKNPAVQNSSQVNQHPLLQQQTQQRPSLMKPAAEQTSGGKYSVMEKNNCSTVQSSVPMQHNGQNRVMAQSNTTSNTTSVPITLPSSVHNSPSTTQTPPHLAPRARHQSNRPLPQSTTTTRSILGLTNPRADSVVVSSSVPSQHTVAASAPFRSSTLASYPATSLISQSTNCLLSDNGFASSSPLMNCLNGSSNSLSTTQQQQQQQQQQSRAISNSTMIMYPINYDGTNQFFNNLLRMDQTKIWEEARCRTFYARDNVCNFIEWSKEFGVNQSVLFESDDLVLHANPRQVVLCLLDVARIAYVKYGFTEAPGLVKFEQEIDRELAAERAAAMSDLVTDYKSGNSAKSAGSKRLVTHDTANGYLSNGERDPATAIDSHKSSINNGSSSDGPKRFRRGLSLAADATDELIMRYCKHKEEEAARRKSEEINASAAAVAVESVKNAEADLKANTASAGSAADGSSQVISAVDTSQPINTALNDLVADKLVSGDGDAGANANGDCQDNDDDGAYNGKNNRPFELDSLMDDNYKRYQSSSTSPNGPLEATMDNEHIMAADDEDDDEGKQLRAGNLFGLSRIDSLDSTGEGPVESSSTGRGSSQTPSASGSSSTTSKQPDYHSEDIITSTTRSTATTPVPARRSHFSPTMNAATVTTATTTSELSSSRSSLLSAFQDNCPDTPSAGSGRQITSDLDGKVMRIAKSYYGKGVSKGVTRLSEGKYRIADRIVFVRLLKGHRVMVRIGGGWDTLENFLFRHKSDPSQVIDVDNLLPIETKMAFDKSATPISSNNKSISKLPYYGRSNSASSTNLSISNRSFSDHSLSNSISKPNKTKPLLAASSTIDTSSPVVTSSGSTSTLIQSGGPTPTHNSKSSLAHTKSPYFLIHRDHKNLTNMTRLPYPAFHHNHLPQSSSGSVSASSTPSHTYNSYVSSVTSSTANQQLPHQQQLRTATITNSNGSRLPKAKMNHNSNNDNTLTPSYVNKYHQRPLASSRAPTASATNLYPATLTTRFTPVYGRTKAGLTNNIRNNSNTSSSHQRNESVSRKLGRSSDSIQQLGALRNQ